MDFYAPNIIRAGKNALSVLSAIKGVRALVVSDREAVEGAVLSALSAGGLDTRVFRMPAEGGMAAVDAGKKALMEFKPDWVAAVGAASAINAAKLMRIFYEFPGLSPADAVKGGAPERMEGTRMAALPLLNSSGAEATDEAYFVFRGAREVIKGRSIMADMIAIDPELIACCTETEYANGAIAALGMAIEAAALGTSDFATPLAVHAARIVYEKTPAFAGEMKNRADIANAQCLAGLAYTNSNHGELTAFRKAHAALGAQENAAWETAIYLPRIIRAGAGEAGYVRMARELSLPGEDKEELSENLAAMVEEYSDMLGLPETLGDIGLDRNEFLKNLTRAAKAAAEGGGWPQEQAEALLRSAY